MEERLGYLGKYIDEMTREELITCCTDIIKRYNELYKQNCRHEQEIFNLQIDSLRLNDYIKNNK